MPARGPIRVMLVDDHDMLRSSLSVLFDTYEDLALVGEATNGTEAIELCGTILPDVVLMDLVMPETDGTTATRIIRERYPSTQVLVLTSFNDPDLVQSAIRAGAISYVLKNISASDLADAVRAAYDGHSVMSPEAIEALSETGELNAVTDEADLPSEES